MKAEVKSMVWAKPTETRKLSAFDKTIKASIKRLLNGKKTLFEIDFYDSAVTRNRINERIWADVCRKRDAKLDTSGER